MVFYAIHELALSFSISIHLPFKGPLAARANPNAVVAVPIATGNSSESKCIKAKTGNKDPKIRKPNKRSTNHFQKKLWYKK